MRKKSTFTLFISVFTLYCSFAQLPDNCKLSIGTNLGGLADYGTELPFVDLMHNSRVFYSQDYLNPAGGPFNTEATDSMAFRPDGYPTHVPQIVAGRTYPQKISTIWGATNGWPYGTYTVLYDGAGSLSFWGGINNLIQTSPNRLTFEYVNNNTSVIQMTIDSSSIANPIRNIRVLMPGSEATYQTQPFNPTWLSKVLQFKSLRFMDWGQTNNWGQTNQWDWAHTALFDWNERASMDYQTWANNKGVPYEMMIKLLNDYDLDGWVCVPHRASNDYINNMATLFKNTLETDRHLTVEYSNEIWNWMFGQAQWCLKYGEITTGLVWPECIVPYVQNCLDQWTAVYGTDVHRITRTVGLQTGWTDVSVRISHNLMPGSFDAVSPTYYFGLGEEADAVLDIAGANATVSQIAGLVRSGWANREKLYIQEIKTYVADTLHVPMVFYEGGQHLTPTPFGEIPTYEQALLDIQRDTAMYNLYNEWFDFIRTMQTGNEPLQIMNFSFVGERSARYGSWGLLETLDQDFTLVPAPKYQATLENMAKDCGNSVSIKTLTDNNIFSVYPNPTDDFILISADKKQIVSTLKVVDIMGKTLLRKSNISDHLPIDISNLPNGIYLVLIETAGKKEVHKIVKQ